MPEQRSEIDFDIGASGHRLVEKDEASSGRKVGNRTWESSTRRRRAWQNALLRRTAVDAGSAATGSGNAHKGRVQKKMSHGRGGPDHYGGQGDLRLPFLTVWRGSDTIDELFKNFANQDKQGSAASFAGIVCNSTVNDEFMETVLVCSLERQKGKGHCLGRALVGAMSRRVECEKKSNNGSQAIGCPWDSRHRCQQDSDRAEKSQSVDPEHAT